MMAQQHRVMVISGVISIVLGFLGGFLGGRFAAPPVKEMPAPAVLQAESLHLVDQAGRKRAQLGMDGQGMARLGLYGDNGASLASLTADSQGGASLALGDDRRQRAVVLNVAAQGSQGLVFYRDGKMRLALEVQQGGEPAVNLYDKGNRVASLSLTGQGDPHLTFYGDHQKAALELISKKSGDRSLDLLGKDGIPRMVLGLKNDQKAALGLFDRKGKTRAALMDEPSLILLKNGKVVRTLP
jgi:hypothetical protein